MDRAARQQVEATRWKEAIEATITKVAGRDDLMAKQLGEGQDNTETILNDGYLATCPDAKPTSGSQPGRGPWPLKFYALTSTALYVAEEEFSVEASFVYLISPTCSVFETRLNAHAFELVTPQGVIHLYGATAGESKRWIGMLRDVIRDSSGLVSDPLLRAAKALAPTTYEVAYTTKKNLGIVLERAAEWPLVKLGNDDDVTEGSALIAVNDTSTMLQPYQQTIKMFAGWQPPLKLKVRAARA